MEFSPTDALLFTSYINDTERWTVSKIIFLINNLFYFILLKLTTWIEVLENKSLNFIVFKFVFLSYMFRIILLLPWTMNIIFVLYDSKNIDLYYKICHKLKFKFTKSRTQF